MKSNFALVKLNFSIVKIIFCNCETFFQLGNSLLEFETQFGSSENFIRIYLNMNFTCLKMFFFTLEDHFRANEN